MVAASQAGAGKKDYDWAHLAMRYWPKRVDAKCQQDPSLAVAHAAFGGTTRKRAWAWELRLQDEIAQDFPDRRGALPRRRGAATPTGPCSSLSMCATDSEVITSEALRRIRKRKRPILESADPRSRAFGAWSRTSAGRSKEAIIKKQKRDFRLRAPDEPAPGWPPAADPALEAKRATSLESLKRPDMLFGDDDDGMRTTPATRTTTTRTPTTPTARRTTYERADGPGLDQAGGGGAGQVSRRGLVIWLDPSDTYSLHPSTTCGRDAPPRSCPTRSSPTAAATSS